MVKLQSVALALCLLVSAGLATAAPGVSPRTIIPLSEGWRFQFGAQAGEPQQDAFTDESWAKVQVPHSWNRVGYYFDKSAPHINRADNVNKEQGIGWYRLRFTAPATSNGKKAWLQFDAASRTAEVWLNGVRLGEHRGGFSRFRFDATKALRPGQSNLLAVKVDNSVPKAGSSTADVLPLTGDFFVDGGLYRPASLILTNAVHFDMLDLGGPGIYASTTAIAGKQADVAVQVRLRNDSAEVRPVHVTARLINAAGATSASAQGRLSLVSGASSEAAYALRVPAAHLWQGTADPYLYSLRVELRSASGQLLDSVEQPFGIRQMRLDPEKGFFLNGKSLRLHGVGLHQDREGKGWAINEQDVADEVATIREMGANTIRLTHYQHGQPIHDLADRYGLVLWDEIPLVTAWTTSPEQKDAPPAILANARQQLKELIRQNYNHPSVAVWGIANEVDFGPGRPDFLGVAPPMVPDPMPLLRDLNALAKSEDPSRPTTIANCCEDRGMPLVPITGEATDANGANRYFGWYYGQPAELSAHLDALRAKRPMQPLSVSEYGAGGALTIHTDDPRGGPIDMGGRVQPEEYQSWVHEENWRILSRKPYLWATWLWNSFDFGTAVRREGDSQDINTKGLVTYDHLTRKDAYYFYKANWSSKPTVYVTGRRYVDRAYPVTDVKVYSNARRTELLMNGRSLGAKSACADSICVWPAVRLAAGPNRIEAKAAFASGTVADRVDWQLRPTSAQAFRIDSGSIVAATAAGRQFGSDAFFEGGAAGSADKRPRGRPPVLAAIKGSAARDLVATYREGQFHYRVPLSPGRYKVTLTFVEPIAAPGARTFDVLANGVQMIGKLDVAAEAGAPLTAIERSFDIAADGRPLDLEFRPVVGKAIVSAIEVVPAP